MKIENIRDRILEMCTLFGFEYNGIKGNIDPYGVPGGKDEFLLYYDGDEQIVYDIEAVMTTPFIGGKSLTEVVDVITITDW